MVAELSTQDLRQGRLGEIFRGGYKAAILVGDDRVGHLWDLTVADGSACGLGYGASGILSLARNHQAENLFIGDMLRFVPGSYAHAARKIVVFPDGNGDSLAFAPQRFWDTERQVRTNPEACRIAWELMSEVRSSVLPPGAASPLHAVRIETLHYPSSADDLDRICALLADSGGRWTRFGQRVDGYKASAAGMFNRKGLRDLFALGCLVPGLGAALRRANDVLNGFEARGVPEHMRVIGRAHVDRSKELTALASDRDAICTEIYDDNRWTELPLARDRLAILPSVGLARLLGTRPTIHRVLQVKESPGPAGRPNVTLSLAVVRRPTRRTIEQESSAS